MSILGYGVDALDKESLLSEVAQGKVETNKLIGLHQIRIGHYQPRKGTISDESIEELAASIKEQGVLQPIIVRAISDNKYELIAGERRFKSCLYLGLKSIPAIIKDVSEKAAYAIAIVENIQRQQLNVLEEAEAMLRLKNEYGLTAEETARSVGKPRTSVANYIRLAEQLSAEAKQVLSRGVVGFGHVRAVLSLDPFDQVRIIEDAEKNELSVRKLEKRIREGYYFKELTSVENDSNESMLGLRNAFADKLKKNVVLKMDSRGKVKVSITFNSLIEANQYLDEEK